MKIKRVDNKPMKIHSKQKPKLKIKKKSKTRTASKKFTIRTRKGMRKSLKLKDGCVKVKHQKLKAAMRTGGQLATKQVEGGEELQESVDLASTLAAPIISASKQSSMVAKRKFQKKAIKRQQRKRSRRITKEDYAKNNLHIKRSSQKGKVNSRKEGKKQSGKVEKLKIFAYFLQVSFIGAFVFG